MDTQTSTACLRRMMKPYQGPQHTVVAFNLKDGNRNVIRSGPNETGASWQDLVFEIGSITKVFTGILLCLLSEEGIVDPRAPVSEMSDVLSDVPHWITPERLISHTSGLPNIYFPIWKALFLQQPEGPYARFGRTELLAWMRNWRGRSAGTHRRHRYSNLGVGLLGEAMAIQQGKPFAELLANKVIHPLGLNDTSGDLDDNQLARFMQPRNTAGKPVMPWNFDALAGAGYLRSTAHDMACFSGCVIQAFTEPRTLLDRAIRRSAKPVFGLGRRGHTNFLTQCSGWLATKGDKSSPSILLANGGTAGSTCALYLCPERENAFAILSNNGVAANLWASSKLNWSNPMRQAQDFLTAP